MGIGGKYLCVYGMESPGGYQLIGRTVPIWSGYRQRAPFETGKPWLFRFFDRISWYPVAAEELLDLCADMSAGRFEMRTGIGEFAMAEHLDFLNDHAADIATIEETRQAAFTAERLRWEAGGELNAQAVPIPGPEAAELLYDGAIVAQRYAAVGEFLSSSPEGSDPVVSAIITGGAGPAAHAYVADLDRLAHAAATARRLFAEYPALLLPTTTEHPTIETVAAEPVAINSRMGTFTNFCNLLDLAAVAVPGTDTADGDPFGVMFVTPAFADQVGIDLAARLLGEPSPCSPTPAPISWSSAPICTVSLCTTNWNKPAPASSGRWRHRRRTAWSRCRHPTETRNAPSRFRRKLPTRRTVSPFPCRTRHIPEQSAVAHDAGQGRTRFRRMGHGFRLRLRIIT